MPTRFAVACDEARDCLGLLLVHRYGITEEEVVTQLIDLGLESVEEEAQ